MNGEASVPTFALTARISLPIVPFALFATAISEVAPGPIGIVSSPPVHDFVNSDIDIVSDADEEFVSEFEGPVASLHDVPEEFSTGPSDDAKPHNTDFDAKLSLGNAPLYEILARPEAADFLPAIDAELLDLPETFRDNRAAFERVNKRDVPDDATVFNTMMYGKINRKGDKKMRWVVNASRKPGEPRMENSSSPTARVSSFLTAMAVMAATFHCVAAGEVDCEWHDITNAYMEADTQICYFSRYPPGFARYMQLTGDNSFNPHHCLLRARKNVYGHPTSGRVWFDLCTHFLKHDVGFIQYMPFGSLCLSTNTSN